MQHNDSYLNDIYKKKLDESINFQEFIEWLYIEKKIDVWQDIVVLLSPYVYKSNEKYLILVRQLLSFMEKFGPLDDLKKRIEVFVQEAK